MKTPIAVATCGLFLALWYHQMSYSTYGQGMDCMQRGDAVLAVEWLEESKYWRDEAKRWAEWPAI